MVDEFEHVEGPKREDLKTYMVRVARLDAIQERVDRAMGFLRQAEECFTEACLVEDEEKISIRWAVLDSMRSKTTASRESCVFVLVGVREELERARAMVYEIQQTAD